MHSQSLTQSAAHFFTLISHFFFLSLSLSLPLSLAIAHTHSLTFECTHQTWTSVRPTMAIATANAHAPTRRVVAPVTTVRVVGPTMEIRNAKVGAV